MHAAACRCQEHWIYEETSEIQRPLRLHKRDGKRHVISASGRQLSVYVPLYLQPPAARCLYVPGRYLPCISAPSAKPRMTRHQGNSPSHWLKLFHPAKFQQSPSPQFIITISDSQRLQGSDQSSEGSQREALIAHLCLLLAFQKRNNESA